LYPDDRVIASRVARLALENLHPNRSLFKKFLAAFKLMLNNVGEELLAARTVPEGLAFEDSAEFRKDRRFFGIGEAGTFVVPADDRFSCYSHGLNPWYCPLIMGL
jgi:hypothetical protein